MENESSRPHTALIHIQIYVHSITNLGEMSGQIVNKEILRQVGIPSSIILSVPGMDLEECVENLKSKLKEWNMGENNDNNRT